LNPFGVIALGAGSATGQLGVTGAIPQGGVQPSAPASRTIRRQR